MSNNRRFLLAFVNHVLWSSQPVASRYLQVFAEPVVFDGLGVLCTAKAASAILLFAFSHTVCPDKKNNTAETVEDDVDTEEQTLISTSSASPRRQRTKIFFALLFGTVATFRAALNIASSKFTLSFYTSKFNGRLCCLRKKTACMLLRP
jgi:hypothetical protein